MVKSKTSAILCQLRGPEQRPEERLTSECLTLSQDSTRASGPWAQEKAEGCHSPHLGPAPPPGACPPHLGPASPPGTCLPHLGPAPHTWDLPPSPGLTSPTQDSPPVSQTRNQPVTTSERLCNAALSFLKRKSQLAKKISGSQGFAFTCTGSQRGTETPC